MFENMLWILVIAVLQSSLVSSSTNCSNVWNNVLQTGSAGNVETGSKKALIDAILHGAELQIYIPGWDYATSAQAVTVLSNDRELCAQALFHISKDSWETFRPNGHWYFLLICTNGHIEKSVWYPGSETGSALVNTPSESSNRQRVAWFVRSGRDTPVYCNSDRGQPTCGHLQDLISMVKAAADIKVVNQGSSPFTVVTVLNNTSVSGQYSWGVSTEETPGHLAFEKNASWRFTIHSTSGLLDISRWYPGAHGNGSRISSNAPMKWFADTCWSMAYQHDKQGNPLNGSMNILRSAIGNGHRIKLVMVLGSNEVAYEADNLLLGASDVSAQQIGQFLDKLSNTTYLDTIHISTNGQAEAILYDMITLPNSTAINERFGATWYVDSRHWKHALRTSVTGLAKLGTKSNLIRYIRQGSMLRCVIHFSSDHVLAAQADNIEFSPDGTNVGAQILRVISYDFDGTNGRQFKIAPSWRFTIASTKGTIIQSEWMVGNHTSRVTNTSSAEIDWFVS